MKMCGAKMSFPKGKKTTTKRNAFSSCKRNFLRENSKRILMQIRKLNVNSFLFVCVFVVVVGEN